MASTTSSHFPSSTLVANDVLDPSEQDWLAKQMLGSSLDSPWEIGTVDTWFNFFSPQWEPASWDFSSAHSAKQEWGSMASSNLSYDHLYPWGQLACAGLIRATRPPRQKLVLREPPQNRWGMGWGWELESYFLILWCRTKDRVSSVNVSHISLPASVSSVSCSSGVQETYWVPHKWKVSVTCWISISVRGRGSTRASYSTILLMSPPTPIF